MITDAGRSPPARNELEGLAKSLICAERATGSFILLGGSAIDYFTDQNTHRVLVQHYRHDAELEATFEATAPMFQCEVSVVPQVVGWVANHVSNPATGEHTWEFGDAIPQDVEFIDAEVGLPSGRRARIERSECALWVASCADPQLDAVERLGALGRFFEQWKLVDTWGATALITVSGNLDWKHPAVPPPGTAAWVSMVPDGQGSYLGIYTLEPVTITGDIGPFRVRLNGGFCDFLRQWEPSPGSR